MVFFSVIIPTCNRNDNLARCLEALQEAKNVLQFERRDLCCEVIVSDDGPSPNAEGLIAEKFTWAKWIDGPKRGPAANRNNAQRTLRESGLFLLTTTVSHQQGGWLHLRFSRRRKNTQC